MTDIQDRDDQRGTDDPTPPSAGTRFTPLIRRIIGAVLLAAAVACFIGARKQVTCDEYQFYSAHYARCEEERADAVGLPDRTGMMFSGIYDTILSTYDDMMESDQKVLHSYRVKAAVLTGAGVSGVLIGGVLLFWRKKVR